MVTAPRRVVLLACMLLPAACGRFTVDKHVAATQIQSSPRRMLLLSRLGDARGIPLADSFHAALQSRLAACGVETRLEVPDALALNSTQKVVALVQGFKPDSVLLIQQTVRVNGDPIAGEFLVTLRLDTEKRDLWKASANVSPPGGSGREFGADAAARLVATMAADGVLRNCSLPPA